MREGRQKQKAELSTWSAIRFRLNVSNNKADPWFTLHDSLLLRHRLLSFPKSEPLSARKQATWSIDRIGTRHAIRNRGEACSRLLTPSRKNSRLREAVFDIGRRHQ